MTLADAEATAMTGTIPEQEPRIERSGYIGAAEALAALGTAAAPAVYLDGRDGLLEDHLLHGGGHNALGEPGGPIVMVELSQLGMDILGTGASSGERQATVPDRCRPVPAAQRYAVTLFIDPRSAVDIGHTLEALPDGLWAVASPAVDHVRVTATPWPSPVPSETPEPDAAPMATQIPSPTHGPLVDPDWPAIPLGVGEYPAALRDAITAWPLVVGSTWTYRAKAHDDALAWRTWMVTETVVAATRRGQELMEVELASASIEERGSPWVSIGGGRARPLIVRRDALLHAWPGVNDTVSQAEALATLPPAGTRPGHGLDAPLMDMLRFPMALGGSPTSWWSVRRVEPIASTAGSFPGCHLVTEVINVGNVAGHWLCPGVGFARHELPGCGTYYGSYTVFDLIDYAIPPLVAVE